MSRMKFMNTEIDNITMEEAVQKIDELVREDRNAYVVTPNVDCIVKLERDAKLREIYEYADLILADGKPLIWISKLYGKPIKEKVSGSDLFPRICEMAEQKGYSLFLLGAADGVAQKAADNLKDRFPKLQIKGVYSPPMGFEKNEKEIEKTISIVRNASPHILIVGLGCPKQELLIYKYRERLKAPISLGLGATIDFEAGSVKRAPQWISDHGLEWLFRFSREPKRLFKRYFIDDMRIISLVIKYRKV